MARHAEEHAGAIVEALCRIGAAGESSGGRRDGRLDDNDKDGGAMSMEVRETALEALVAATSLPFSAVYPQRRAAAAAATAALDDPKRRVRRAAARCRQVWQALNGKMN